MLRPISSIYGFVIRVRNRLYDTGVFTTHHSPVCVVSVGNIEVGGTGKTPFTITLARELKTRGYRVAIVTRGYKGRIKGTVLVHPEDAVEDVGDETLLMARTAGVAVIKSPDRVAGAVYAHKELGSQIVIMDDGFQHRRIHRDLDIVLVAGDVHNDALLPKGRLRESATSLARADFLVHTKGSSSNGMHASLTPQGLIDSRGTILELSLLRGRNVLAFCGIARPDHFFKTLVDLGADVDTLTFRDHHLYTDRDIARIEHRARDKDYIITTEKDLVKLNTALLNDRWLALRVVMDVAQIETIIREIESIVEDRHISRPG